MEGEFFFNKELRGMMFVSWVNYDGQVDCGTRPDLLLLRLIN